MVQRSKINGILMGSHGAPEQEQVDLEAPGALDSAGRAGPVGQAGLAAWAGPAGWAWPGLAWGAEPGALPLPVQLLHCLNISSPTTLSLWLAKHSHQANPPVPRDLKELHHLREAPFLDILYKDEFLPVLVYWPLHQKNLQVGGDSTTFQNLRLNNRQNNQTNV